MNHLFLYFNQFLGWVVVRFVQNSLAQRHGHVPGRTKAAAVCAPRGTKKQTERECSAVNSPLPTPATSAPSQTRRNAAQLGPVPAAGDRRWRGAASGGDAQLHRGPGGGAGGAGGCGGRGARAALRPRVRPRRGRRRRAAPLVCLPPARCAASTPPLAAPALPRLPRPSRRRRRGRRSWPPPRPRRRQPRRGGRRHRHGALPRPPPPHPPPLPPRLILVHAVVPRLRPAVVPRNAAVPGARARYYRRLRRRAVPRHAQPRVPDERPLLRSTIRGTGSATDTFSTCDLRCYLPVVRFIVLGLNAVICIFY
jgi:hypothetical protein